MKIETKKVYFTEDGDLFVVTRIGGEYAYGYYLTGKLSESINANGEDNIFANKLEDLS